MDCIDIETIEITDKFVGFVRYPDGFWLFNAGACDSHFVAFDTNKPIDKLLEADVYYTKQNISYDYFKGGNPFKTDFGESETDNYASLSYKKKVEYTGSGLFKYSYEWDKIQTVDDFVDSVNSESVYHGAVIDATVASKITDEALAELKNNKWVLRFTETSFTESPKSAMGAGTYYHAESTMVGDVTILRLKFETDGVVYNLGVIDNKQSGGKEPSNSTETEITVTKDFERLVQIVLGALLLILLLVILTPILPSVISLAIKIVLFPFRLLAMLFKAIFHKKE